MAPSKGFGPLTDWLTASRSTGLSHDGAKCPSATFQFQNTVERIRTFDRLVNSQPLYRAEPRRRKMPICNFSVPEYYLRLAVPRKRPVERQWQYGKIGANLEVRPWCRLPASRLKTTGRFNMNPEFAKIIITQKKNMTIISRGAPRANNIKVQTLNKSLFFVFVALDLAACFIGMGSGNPVVAFVLTGFDFLLFAFAFEYFNYKQVWRLSFYVRCLSLPLVFFSQTYLFLYGFAAASGLARLAVSGFHVRLFDGRISACRTRRRQSL